jgi:acid phosphatase (class A)
MNMNMNMNMAVPGTLTGNAATRVRFNTQDYRKYVKLNPFNITEPVIPASFAAMRYFPNWDADLRTYEYLNEFLLSYPDWRARLTASAVNLTPPYLMTAAGLTQEIQQMLDRAPDREDRFAEIIDQHDAEGAIGYFFGMLLIDPARMPATNLLVRVARRIGEHVAMCLKGEFRCPRPSQFCSAIVPMIDPPATSAFPSGHSLQARLIGKCLEGAAPPMRPLHLLEDLAERIGENRIVAGLHFPADHAAGKAVGAWCFDELLDQLPAEVPGPNPGDPPIKLLFPALKAAATAEFRNQP